MHMPETRGAGDILGYHERRLAEKAANLPRSPPLEVVRHISHTSECDEERATAGSTPVLDGLLASMHVELGDAQAQAAAVRELQEREKLYTRMHVEPGSIARRLRAALRSAGSVEIGTHPSLPVAAIHARELAGCRVLLASSTFIAARLPHRRTCDERTARS